jgi:hypothetical protein
MTSQQEKILQEDISRIIDDHSGGLKFTELLSCIANQPDSTFCWSSTCPDDILNTIRKMPCFGVLNYIMNLGAGMGREKHFIYRKDIE